MNMLILKFKVNWRLIDSIELLPEIAIAKELNKKRLLLDSLLGPFFYLVERVS